MSDLNRLRVLKAHIGREFPHYELMISGVPSRSDVYLIGLYLNDELEKAWAAPPYPSNEEVIGIIAGTGDSRVFE